MLEKLKEMDLLGNQGDGAHCLETHPRAESVIHGAAIKDE